MRSISLSALVLLILALSTEVVSGQGKGSPDKFPTEVGGKDLDKWIQEIKDTDPVNRQAAIQAVVQFGPAGQKALTALAVRLIPFNEHDYVVRADAAVAIQMLGLANQDKAIHDRVMHGLIEALADPQRPVRLQVIAALGRIGPDAREAIGKLVLTLKDDSWQVRMASVHALSAVGRGEKGADPRAMTALLGALSDDSLLVRIEAINALVQLGPAPTAQLAADERKILADRLRTAGDDRDREKDQRARLWLRVLFMFIDEKNMTKANLAVLAKELDSTDAKVRAAATQVLGTLGKHAQAHAPDLMRAVSDPSAEVRLGAIAALARVGDPECVPLLAKLLKDDKEDKAIRIQVMTYAPALGAGGSPLVGDFIALLANKDPELVAAAINGLSAFADQAQPAIADLKKLAANGIAGLNQRTRDEFLKEADEDAIKKDKFIKDAASEAIKRINDAKK